ICFTLCSGTNIRGVPGPTSLCAYAFVDYLSLSSHPLDLLGTRCRHPCSCHIWILSDGESAFAPTLESRRADHDRFAASNISVPTKLPDRAHRVSSAGCAAGLCSIEAQAEPGTDQGGTNSHRLYPNLT